MDVSLFDFELPEDRIALRPAEPREAARLLVVPGDDSAFDDRLISDFPSLLREGDAVVVNDTRVIPADLDGVRVRGEGRSRVHVNLLQRRARDEWMVLLRPAKKVESGDVLEFGADDGDVLRADVLSRSDDHAGAFIIRFGVSGAKLEDALERHGKMPLPPYISSRRAGDDADNSDYQTVFAAHAGAVAAPTAGLHFTPALLADIEGAGASLHRVTLHVGGGTFLPVKAADTDNHVMHAEWGRVTESTAAALRQVRERGNRIVCIGTTSLRILESSCMATGEISAFEGETKIFITPGYRFAAVDVLLTNFHLPRSTLFMLVAAFSGLERMKSAYAHAIETGYRFYSYGDACLLERSTAQCATRS